jgi:uncharacterized Fe-S cluster-containing radical SAM superfamily protein
MYSLEERVHFLEKTVVAGDKKKYYRFRPASFYGGIATADCVGCPLKCVFCWSGFPRDYPEKAGKWYTSTQVFEKLDYIATKKGYSQVRISGNEPTVGQEHLLNLLHKVGSKYQFILETSGVLIDDDFAVELSSCKNVHVRVSLKGTYEQEFSMLTGAPPDGFKTQLYALKTLVDHNVSCHPAVMASFSSPARIKELEERLSHISSDFYLEKEEVILYPRVKKRLRKAGLLPE